MTAADRPAVDAAEEARVERAAEALLQAEVGAEFLFEQTPGWREHYRRLAVAALAAAGTDETQAALRRVEALAEELSDEGDRLGAGLDHYDAGCADTSIAAAARIRAALSGDHGTRDNGDGR